MEVLVPFDLRQSNVASCSFSMSLAHIVNATLNHAYGLKSMKVYKDSFKTGKMSRNNKKPNHIGLGKRIKTEFKYRREVQNLDYSISGNFFFRQKNTESYDISIVIIDGLGLQNDRSCFTLTVITQG